MTTVVGGWELSWNTPIKEAELWNLPLRDFGVVDWRMWPVSGIRQNEQAVELTEYVDLVACLDGLGDRPWVFIEPAMELYGIEPAELVRFEHPDDPVYVFGSAHYNPIVAGLNRDGDSVVRVPTVENAGVLWPHQVLVAVLYDRLVKSWPSS